jgi:17beta-estradiol 17-dehydrogenase / very-long-chain 3-oxoacyl-CoA reductase
MLVVAVGYLALVLAAARLLAYLAKYVKSPLAVKKLGDWALITGATDGIGQSAICIPHSLFLPGKGFCLDLAKKGMNIVLVSRSKDKLQAVATEIEEKFKVKTMIIDIDFTKDKNIRERIETEIKVNQSLELPT